jgi:hypothetical protein
MTSATTKHPPTGTLCATLARAAAVTWARACRALFKYEGKKKIVYVSKGDGGLNELAGNFADDECAFAFLRLTVGDEESKRAKFVLVSWCGEKVGALARANMSGMCARTHRLCRVLWC